MMLNIMLILIVLCGAAYAADEPTLEEKFAYHSKDKPRDAFLNLTLENDSLGSGDDRNYTNGIRVGWFDTGDKPPLLAELLDDLVPMGVLGSASAVHYSLGQNLYTPRDLMRSNPDPYDRPYAAFLYGSMGISTIRENHLDNFEFTAGVVGPWALGHETQQFVHEILNEQQPSGWGSQLKNEVGMMVSWERMLPEAARTEMDDWVLRVAPYGGATLGNIYTHANAGVMVQLLPKAFPWQGTPQRVRPAMPGSGYFSVPEDTFTWSLFAGIEGRAVARNIFLDGNTFEDSASVRKRNWVGDASIGASLIFGPMQMNYTLNFRSEEFYGQHRPDVFGALGIGFRF